MKPEDVKIEQTPNGNLRITVPDNHTDTLVVFELHYLASYAPQHICASTMIRGNYSGSERYGCAPRLVRRPVRANVHIEARPVPAEELERRKGIARRMAQEEKEAAERKKNAEG